MQERYIKRLLTLISYFLMLSCEKETGTDGECINLHEQNRMLCEIGYNSIRTDAPIHYHFANSLPSNYSGTDSNWIWEDWISTSESLIKNELFPILGAYEHHYFLIDYEGFDQDDQVILELAKEIGDDPGLTKDGFTGISGIEIKDNGWRVPIHLSRIPVDDGCCMGNCWGNNSPEGCNLDRMSSSVIHEYHHVMMFHQVMNNFQAANWGCDTCPDYTPPWFSEGAAAVLPYMMGMDGGRNGLQDRIARVLQSVKGDESLNFNHMKSWETWGTTSLSIDPFIPLVAYMAYRSSWQIAMVDCFRAMGLQEYPGNFDNFLISLIEVNQDEFLNDALEFFRLETTTTDILMPPDLPVEEIIGPPQLSTLD